MSVVSSKELPRKAEYQIGQPRKLTREFVCILSDDTPTNPTAETEIFQHLGIDLGSQHPTYPDQRVRTMKLTEGFDGSAYFTHVTFDYGIILLDELLHPTQRSAVWDFDSSPGEVPALTYYDGSTLRPLTNSAGDYFPGLVTQESTVVAIYSKNYLQFPSALFQAQNKVNSATYLGCPLHTIKAQNLKVKTVREEFQGAIASYWQATMELHYRQSGHNLQLPDVGWNFILNNQRRRAMVFDAQNNEWVASPNPVGLDGNGGLTLGLPAILNRRVNPETDFSTLFGTPPTTPPAI